jgi:dephospho-CoA kinase
VFHPAGRSIIVIAFGWLVLASMFAIICFASVMWSDLGDARGPRILLPVVLFVVILGLAAIVRNACRFELSSTRVAATRGVFRRFAVEARLDDIRNVAVSRSLLQRLLRLGTIRMNTAGIGPSVVWNHVDEPGALAERVRAAIDSTRNAMPAATASASIRPVGKPISSPVTQLPVPILGPHRPAELAAAAFPVIGIAGGIGAGKSAVAAAFARLGCFVIDSDARAKAALDREDVREALVSWWGPGILSAEGRVDRSRVASIVFTNAAERERLEQLVHPIVREDRAQMIRDARAAGAKAAIVDAPLLFEAGVDAECDCVVFVESPREVRVERVRRSRGWDEQELDRREAAQMPLEEKRARCRFVVENLSDTTDLDAQVDGILRELTGQAGVRGQSTEK